MPQFQAEVHVELKPLVNDPEGLVIRDGLNHVGFPSVRSVRAGKCLVIELDADSQAAAEESVRQMCEKLLANPVIEDFRFQVREPAPA